MSIYVLYIPYLTGAEINWDYWWNRALVTEKLLAANYFQFIDRRSEIYLMKSNKSTDINIFNVQFGIHIYTVS